MKKTILTALVLVMALLISTAVSFGASRYDEFASDRSTFYHNSVFDDSIIVNGIDISAWQDVISVSTFKKMKAQGIDFVILRCGYTGSVSLTSHLDDCFEKNYANALEAGMEIGIYYYSLAGRATTAPTSSNLSSRKTKAKKEAKAEADFVLKHIKGKTVTYPIFIDIEDPDLQSKSGKTVLATVANSFCEAIEAADPNYEAGVYASLSWLNNKIGTISSKYDIWVAQYYSKCQYEKPYMMWQYTSSGKVSGFSKRLDVNFRYLSDKEITSENSLANATVKLSSTSVTYSGSQKKPTVTVTLGDVELVKDQDYRVAYYKNVKAGTASVVVSGINQYTDCKIANFTIKPYSLTTYEIKQIKDVAYSNSSITPSIVVEKIGGTKTLVMGTDYAVKCSNNTNVGVADVKVTGKGNYGGTLTAKFNISKGTPTLKGTETLYLCQRKEAQLDVKSTLGATVKYKTSDDNVATVSSSGLVKAVGFGKCTVIAYCPSTSNTKYVAKEIPVTVENQVKSPKIKSIGLTWADITWTNIGCASKYYVYKYDAKTGKYSYLKSTTTNTLRISGLAPNKEYQYTVKAKDPQGHTGTRSEAVLVAPKIKTVKGFTATDVYSHSATLTWKKQSEVSGFKIYKYNPSTKKYEYIKKLVGNDKISYPVKGLTSAKVYKYRICSYYNSINGPKTTLEFSTKPLKMTITKLTSSNKSLTVKWKKVRGKRYVIYYSTNSKFTNRKAIVLSTKYSSYTIDNLKKSTKYYVKMRAYTVYDDKKIYGKYSDVKTKNL